MRLDEALLELRDEMRAVLERVSALEEKIAEIEARIAWHKKAKTAEAA
jgi:predicted  nucleic acid-binding Zn-ribbon protein